MAIATPMTLAADLDMLPTVLEDEEFAQWAQLLEQHVGLRASLVRKSFLVQCVETRMRKRGIGSRSAYLDLLRASHNNEDEWDALIDLLPLHETRFARHESSLRLVRDHVIARCASGGNVPERITLWSAGCSSGEEAYTLAITAHEAVRACGRQMYINVVGSDVCNHSLAAARRGTYHRRQLSELTSELRVAWFDRVDDEMFSVKPQLRAETQFVPINLAHPEADASHIGMVDVVFCQNVLIYFDNETRERVCNRLAEHLLPGGLMVLGAGELVRWSNTRMKRMNGDDTLAYKKVSAGAGV